MAEGVVPWRKPWSGVAPANLVTKKPYRGINHLILSCAPYSSPWWLTYKQAKRLGGHVKKGEKSTIVIFWKFIEKEKEAEDGTIEKATIPLLRYYRVFNAEQCELPDGVVPETNRAFRDIREAEAIVANMPDKPKMTFGGDRAYYSNMLDLVNVPVKQAFAKEEEFYATLFHELVHSTGNEKRLGRKELMAGAMFGDCDYSKEELVAELGSAFLCAKAGIDNSIIENSAAYIKSWLAALKNDPKMLVHAAGKAQQAADYILNENN